MGCRQTLSHNDRVTPTLFGTRDCGPAAQKSAERADYDTIRRLVRTVEAKNVYTRGHSLRVQHWALEVARKLGFGEPRLRALSCAGELHDAGKLAVPDQILNRPRPLTDREWAVVRKHPARSVDLIEHIGLSQPAIPAIRHHHERLDGHGYPDGLAGEEIPLEARILAVVDAYDAMTSHRPYRMPLPHEAAKGELLRCSKTQFDPACVAAFLGLLGERPA